MTVLYVKVDTTGIPKKGATVQNGQARIVRITALLVDRVGRRMGALDALMKPDDTWVSSKAARDKHGILESDSVRYGVRPKAALATLMDMGRAAGSMCAFNAPFVDEMVDIELAHLGASNEDWRRPGMQRICMMTEASQILRGGAPVDFRGAMAGFYPDQRVVDETGPGAVESLVWMHAAAQERRLKRK